MQQDEPRIIPFQNPIDPDAAPIDAEARIVMSDTAAGGLKEPLGLPSPTLVFRVPDSQPVLGYTAVIQAPEGVEQLLPGSNLHAQVVFIGVPKDEVWQGREFALWHGRDVGTARILALKAQ